MGRWIRTNIAAAWLVWALAIPSAVAAGEAPLRVLFIGNSLTYTNDLPALVQFLAAADGREISFSAVTAPDHSLEDHWHRGVEEVIRQTRAQVVVMQQGPSSLPSSREHLTEWSRRLAGPIREAGGEPFLLMVWPDAHRMEAFDAVRDSYAGAAQAVGASLIPAGESWRAAWRMEAGLPLFGRDGFHPSLAGSVVTALTVYKVLFPDSRGDCPPISLPDLPEEQYHILCAAAAGVTSGST